MKIGSLHYSLIVWIGLATACGETPDSRRVLIDPDGTILISEKALFDKIKGGLLGQLLGNLNGLEHEAEYFYEPGNVVSYIPGLPEGAWTDDDTDFEWVYVVEMQKEQTLYLSPERLAQLWKERINRNIWCSNQYARYLMDLDIIPPYTGKLALNPWAEFNISGQFLCESFGLMSPGLPQSASSIGLNITSITIDYEPAQTTQLFTSMIAVAFFESDINQILDAGLLSLDPASQTFRIVSQARSWCNDNPDNWRATRQLIRDTYSISDSSDNLRDWNGYEINTAATIAALCYGNGDLVKTLTTAFNFGWDGDNVAASAGTIVGVIKGWNWMMSRNWDIKDEYRNTTRDNMPTDETITSFARRIMHLATLNVLQNGGDTIVEAGARYLRIKPQPPQMVVKLPSMEAQIDELRHQFQDSILRDIRSEDDLVRARACYLAVCFDLYQELERSDQQVWEKAKNSLKGHWKVINNVFYQGDFPGKELLRQRFVRAGFSQPEIEYSNKEEWEDPNFYRPI